MTRLKREYEKLPAHWTEMARMSEALEQVLDEEREARRKENLGDGERSNEALRLAMEQRAALGRAEGLGESAQLAEATLKAKQGDHMGIGLAEAQCQQHSIPASGWPPVGTHCRVTWGTQVASYECVVLPDKQFVTNGKFGWCPMSGEKPHIKFLPLQAPRKRWVEQAKPYVDSMGFASDQLKKIHDALLNGELPVPGSGDNAE